MIRNSISKRFSKDLIAWYHTSGRFDLPWQKNKTAYRVWISEVMLQQTQVTTVIPYYKRFMKSFSSIKKLATADEDFVLSHWSGLGYYARCRNLHKASKVIHDQHKGRFPKTNEELQELPGIGKSTAGAILSFAYDLPTTICDGNVKRVLARVFAVDKPKQTTEAINLFWDIATALTPQEDTAYYNQAIMDVGATICTRTKPACDECPFISYCKAHKLKRETDFPVSKKKKVNPIKHLHLLIFTDHEGKILLEKRPSTGIWGGLWSFPECELDIDIYNWCKKQFGFDIKNIEELKVLVHKFSHYTLNISPLKILIQSNSKVIRNTASQHWHKKNDILPGGIPGPIKRYL
jgi:A/G-specific adenine glycosylase